MKYSHVLTTDVDVYREIIAEEERQQQTIELIPSENYTSLAVREALSSSFTNKYSEGYPGKRYYTGQEHTDVIENLAIKRACELFNCKFANVQPHSGAPANIATYLSLLKHGDTILGMDLSHGGHLTHGHPVTEIAKLFRFIQYKMKNIDTGEIDYDALRDLAIKEKPKMILAGFSAYPRNLDYKKFVDIAKEIGAITVADMSHIAGLIAGKALVNPFDFGFDIITTTTHKTLRGPRGGIILVRENEEFIKKINKTVFPGLQGGPHMNNIAAKAVCFKEAQSEKFQEYAQQILKNAKAMENIFKLENVRMIAGGTDNHLLLLDVETSFGISSKQAEKLLYDVGIAINKNVIPDDKRSPLDPSGIRVGTPAVTTRGFIEEDCEDIAAIIVETLKNRYLTDYYRIFIKKLALKYPILE
ncbi:MAG TPA: serine hydroxymethyltransferase [Sulfurimonas sp. UBA12504]|uniref:Serine hydroxymethyltransferase n=1 Tax=Candidatus Woesebacteria bacterium GW2011_GWA1_40_45 TaxID=1618554 RepID=A0A0G0UTH8_9BACT|nr:MAG: serine hydroxymethyltransferase [Candidatus Woesebacteria bacterium GW2011_GWA1_40_45]DAB30255.1 MAG TPA: serine hydroxymethyltransferase [Sulfurimonas sp. UBA12504]